MDPKTEPWAIVVVLASLIALLLNTGMSFIVGVMHVALLEHYGDNIALTSWIGSLYSCMFALSGPLASMIINRWNCQTCVIVSGICGLIGFSLSSLAVDIRWLFLTYALLAGLGQGLCFTGSLVILGFYFKEKSSTATGIAIAGCGMGNFVLPPLTQKLVSYYGLQGTFLILGGLAGQACVCGCLMRPSKHERKKKEANIQSRLKPNFLKSIRILVTFPFISYLVSVFTFTLGCAGVKLYLPEYIILRGATYEHASFMVSVIGIGSIPSRFLLGVASVEQKIGPALLYAGSIGWTSILVFFIDPLTSTVILRIIFALAYGFYCVGTWTLINPITFELVGVNALATGVGAVMFMCGTGYLVGGPISARLTNATGQFKTAFLFAAVSFLVSSATAFMVSMKSSLPDREITKPHKATEVCIEAQDTEKEEFLK